MFILFKYKKINSNNNIYKIKKYDIITLLTKKGFTTLELKRYIALR